MKVLSFLFFFSLFFFPVWTSGFGHPRVRFWIFFLEIQGGLLSGIFAPHLLFFSLPENVRN